MAHPRDDEYDEAPPTIEPVRRVVPLADVISRRPSYAPAEPARPGWHGWRKVLLVVLVPPVALALASGALLVVFMLVRLILWWAGGIWSWT